MNKKEEGTILRFRDKSRYVFGRWVACFFMLPVIAHAGLIDFEGLVDSEVITNQFAGVTFSHATIAQDGASLNQSELPPRSGLNVAIDDGGAMVLDFAGAVQSFQAYFTYAAPLTVMAFDASNAALANVSSLFSSNLALSGDPGSTPNELLSIVASGVWRIEIAGLNTGGSFVVDDITFESDSQVQVPEPDAGILLGLGLAILPGFLPRRQNGNTASIEELAKVTVVSSAIDGKRI